MPLDNFSIIESTLRERSRMQSEPQEEVDDISEVGENDED